MEFLSNFAGNPDESVLNLLEEESGKEAEKEAKRQAVVTHFP